ncbi:heme peroxidase [Clohesyomyces aquaticus]|uniref:Heme peroxidase n=1 Tax=Clohesyomyces aquaticus TaxID=1231657 RepID=A0A1Y1ZP25_9PLEO|nr:heme peroxidase [Clohesyomyces aquaticus]
MLHPPLTYRGPKFQYRTAGGSNHNSLFPDLGKAGLPYAKSVQGQRATLGAKPDPGDLFDLLMARPEDDNRGRESETGISSFLLYQATIVIHDIFRSNEGDRNISDTSSYLDLAPLTMTDGLLKPDTFAEYRLLNQPPGVSIFLIMYNRFYNYVAKQLLEINENGRFDLPADFQELDNEARQLALEKRDEDLFQVSRLITCGLAISRKDAEWSTDILRLWMGDKVDDKTTQEEVAKGEKMTSAMLMSGDILVPIMMGKIKEANKKATAELEEKQTQPFFASGFDRVGGDFSDMKNHLERQFAFRRNKDGYFDDAQLVAELVRTMEDPMCSFGARQIPKAFKSIEILGILQARKWEVATLNEIRQFFGLPKHERFEDINSDPLVQDRLRDLYEDPDMVELYPGFLCEGQARNLDPNVTCGGGSTTVLWRGVFSDAVTLVRSDRFYTIDWNVGSITAWGMSEVASDPTINKGGLLHRLYQRALPGYFTYNSLHLWQPYYTPEKNLLLAENGLEYQFEEEGVENNTWMPLEPTVIQNGEKQGQFRANYFKDLTTRHIGHLRVRRHLDPNPGRNIKWRGSELASKVAAKHTKIGDYATIKNEVLGGRQTTWANPAIAHPSDIPQGPLREIMTNKYERWDEAMKVVGDCLGADEDKIQSHFLEYFTAIARSIRRREERAFQKTKSPEYQIYQLDVVKDFVIPIVVRFVADWMGFWNRVKTPEHLDREFSENAIFQLIEDCQNYQAWDSDVTKGMKRRQAFQAAIHKLKELADDGVRRSSTGLLYWRNFWRSYGTSGDDEIVKKTRGLAVKTVQALNANGFSTAKVSALMFNFALGSIYKTDLTFTEMLAYFIDPKNLALADSKDDEIRKYVLEAQRLSATPYLARSYLGRKKTAHATEAVPTTLSTLPKNILVLADIHTANRDPKVFPQPNSFKFDRLSSYLFFSPVLNTKKEILHPVSLSRKLSIAALTALLKSVAQLRNLRVAHDKARRLKRLQTPGEGLPGYGPDSSLLRYAAPRWDRLLPSPSSSVELEWGDNADQGHGLNQIWQLGEVEEGGVESRREGWRAGGRGGEQEGGVESRSEGGSEGSVSGQTLREVEVMSVTRNVKMSRSTVKEVGRGVVGN